MFQQLASRQNPLRYTANTFKLLRWYNATPLQAVLLLITYVSVSSDIFACILMKGLH